MAHTCDAIIVSCIDFRFQKYIHDWLNKNLADKTYDYVGFAGSTKDYDIVKKQIDISKKLHQINEVVLIHHEECGAYGIESTPERHTEDLKLARDKILKDYPELKIELYYLQLDGTFNRIQ